MQLQLKINLEFDHKRVDDIIENCIMKGQKGYVCVVDLNNFALGYSNENHLKILNNSIVNICDSSWISTFINKKNHSNYKNYCGPDFFVKYITEKKFKNFFLGSKEDVLNGLKNNFVSKYDLINESTYKSLPFCPVEEFNYKEIAEEINKCSPDIIWVSLGAPKQEQFMASLLPFLKKGVLVGIGAAFDFYSGNKNTKRAPLWIQKIKMEWVYRLFQQPRKQFNRVLFVIKCFIKLNK